LFALISGIVLLRRVNSHAKQQGVSVLRNLGTQIGVGLVAVFLFFGTDMDLVMHKGVPLAPDWKKNAKNLDELYKQAREGDKEAAFQVALCLTAGQGVHRDIARAIEWFSKSDSWKAGCFMGDHYVCRRYRSYGGVSFFNKIIHRRDASFLYHQGEKYVATHPAKALNLFKKSAQYGHPIAQLLVDRYYDNGRMFWAYDVEDVNRIVQETRDFYQKASD